MSECGWLMRVLGTVMEEGNAVARVNEPLQDIDWSALMNDFDWDVSEPGFLGLA
jgi:hypothetical protein